eukprot:4606907-Amphidinium_carterae.1
MAGNTALVIWCFFVFREQGNLGCIGLRVVLLPSMRACGACARIVFARSFERAAPSGSHWGFYRDAPCSKNKQLAS